WSIIPESTGEGYRRVRAGGDDLEGRRAKDLLYEQFALTGKAMASPKRIELLELLAQGPRPVEALARATGMGVTNTSAHLQVLRLEDGMPEWRLAGLPIATGTE